MSRPSAVDAGLLQSRYRLTKQRAAVLHALDDGAHHTAETILDRVRAELPGVSLGTIYRTLDILREIGLVQQFVYGGAARWEATLERHHHLVCVDCGEIRNVVLPSVNALAHAVAEAEGFADADGALVVQAHCPACVANPPTRE